MESSVGLLAALSLWMVLSIVHGDISCFECMDVAYEGDMDLMKQVFPGNHACRDGDKNNMNTTSCTGKCVEHVLKTTFMGLNGEESLDHLIRGCDPFPPNKTDVCINDTEEMANALEKANFTIITSFSGQRCYCATDRCIYLPSVTPTKVTGINCFECKDVAHVGDIPPSIKNTMTSTSSNQACRDGDTTQMETKSCSGKCVVTTMKTTVSGINGEHSLDYLIRGCEPSPPNKTDVCINATEEMANAIEKSNTTIVPSFSGQRCYCAIDRCIGLPSVTPTKVTGVNCFECKDVAHVGNIPPSVKKTMPSASSNQACRDGDTTKMETKSCSGKCVVATMKATGSDDGESYEISYLQRTCDTSPSRTTDGCKIIDVKELKEAMPSLTSIDAQQCYCSTDKCKPAETHTNENNGQPTHKKGNNGQATLTSTLSVLWLGLVMAGTLCVGY